MEEWKEIADFEGLYLISSFGRVKSIINNKILTPLYSKSQRVSCWINEKRKG